jgi:hypothetical protein
VKGFPPCKKSNQTFVVNLRPKPNEEALVEGLAVANRGRH